MFFQGYLQFSNKNRSVHDQSRGYIAIILDCLEKVCKPQASAVDDSAIDPRSARKLLRDARVVWSFVEAVYLSDAVNDDHVSARLATWYACCFPDLIVRGDRMLDHVATGAVNEDEFWDTVTGLAAAGQRDRALRLVNARVPESELDTEQWADAAGAAALGVIPQLRSSHSPLGVAAAVLGNCPRELNASRRDGRWEEWQKRAAQWAVSDEMAEHKHMRRLLGVLGGNTSALADACRDWAQMLVASASYGHDQHGLRGSVSVACAEASAAFEPPQHIGGGALTEAALNNPAGAVINLASCMGTPFFAAHLCDLLVQAEVFPAEGPEEWACAGRGDVGIREYYLAEFARSLERYRGLWRIAAEYYLECPNVGKEPLAAMLARTTFDGAADSSIEKVLGLCKQVCWDSTAALVCERVGAECMQNGQFGAALAWFARGGLKERAHEAAVESLENAEMEGPGSEAATVLDGVVFALTGVKDETLAQSLDYVRVYAEFQSAVAACREKGISGEEFVMRRNYAIEAVLRLIGGGGLARRYWAVALCEIAPYVMVANVPAVPLAMMQELVSSLELVCGKFGSRELTTGVRRKVFFEVSRSKEMEEMARTVSLNDVAKRVDLTRKIFVRGVAMSVFA